MRGYRLTRIPFLSLLYAHRFGSILVLETGARASLPIIIASLPLLFIFVILPRTRDCGWPAFVGILSMIPIIGLVPRTTLIFSPSKILHRKDQVDKNR